MTKMVDALRDALDELLADPRVLLVGQLVKYGLGGMTSRLYGKYPDQVLTFPVCENLMHASAMGLALAGYRPIVVNERMDFLVLAMDPLINHIPVWPLRDRELSLPIVVMAVVGKGKGQGPQHSKNLTTWFRHMDGWDVIEPTSPENAGGLLIDAVRLDSPVLFVVHREFFESEESFYPPIARRVGLCGASKRHEMEFYSREH